MIRPARRSAVLPWACAVLYAGFIFYLSSFPEQPEIGGWTLPEGADKVAHALEYAILGALLWWALRAGGAGPAPSVALAIGIAILFGVSDELHQAFVPTREASFADGVADAVGAAIGAGTLAIASALRARRVS